MTRAFYLTVCITIVYFFLSGIAQGGAFLSDLENALMCKCDDKCGKVLVNCNCSTADKTRKTIQKQLESGLTVEQIIESYVEKYGETVLSSPTKSGFNLTAWITPFAALMGGGLSIRQIIKSWTQRKRGAIETKKTSQSKETQNKYSLQLQKELDKLET